MPIKYERLYGIPTTCNFVLWETDGIDVNATASCVLGDIVIMQNDGASANAANLFSAHASGMGHRVVFTSSEMSTNKLMVRIKDQNSTKEWLDEFLFIETYGHELSQHNRREAGVILETKITAVSGNAEFTIANIPNDNNTLLNAVAMIIDDSAQNAVPDRSFRNVTSYNGSTGVVNLASDTDFTIAIGDRVVFLPTADIASADDIASAVWDIQRADHVAAGTFGYGIDIDGFTGSGKAVLSAITASVLSDQLIVTSDDLPTNFGGMAITGAGEITVGTNNDKTEYTITSAAAASAAAAFLLYNWSALATVSAANTATRTTLNALRFLRNRWGISGSALTVYKENDISAAWTSDLSVVASANSIVDSNPA